MTVSYIWTDVRALEVGDQFWWSAEDTYTKEPIRVNALTERYGDNRVINDIHVCRPSTPIVLAVRKTKTAGRRT